MFISFDPASPRLGICPSKEVTSEMFTGGIAWSSKSLETNEMGLDRGRGEYIVAELTTEHQSVYPKGGGFIWKRMISGGYPQVREAGLT